MPLSKNVYLETIRLLVQYIYTDYRSRCLQICGRLYNPKLHHNVRNTQPLAPIK